MIIDGFTQFCVSLVCASVCTLVVAMVWEFVEALLNHTPERPP